MFELAECRKANPTGYIKMQAFNASIGTESCVHAFIVQRPNYEPGFYCSYETYWSYDRYTIHLTHSSNGAPGERY